MPISRKPKHAISGCKMNWPKLTQLCEHAARTNEAFYGSADDGGRFVEAFVEVFSTKIQRANPQKCPKWQIPPKMGAPVALAA